MRKIKQVILFLLLMIISINVLKYNVYAEDTRYYIKNMNVNVDANNKREFKITETIDVYFDEERHGIIRNIPISTRLEDYDITDISVEGAPYVIEESSNISIKIGDEDETLTGDKTYTITYTMKNYNDERPEGDYIYLNVLGDQWDTKIENFTSIITYPKNSNLEKINVTDGEYGNTDSTNVKYKTESNKIYINSTKTIQPNNAITVNVMLNEGAFKNAPVKQYPYVIKDELINIDITEEKQYIIQRDFKIETNKNYGTDKLIQIDMFDLMNSDNYYLLNISVDGENVKYNERSGYIRLENELDEYNFKVLYTIEPRLSEDIRFRLGSLYLDGKIENLKATINYPFYIDDATVDFYERGANLGTDRFNLEKNDNSITFTNKNTISVGEDIWINLDIDNSLFTRPLPMSVNIIKYGLPVFLLGVIFLFFKFRDKNPITSVVEFYPPRHMNSAEVGYAFNEAIYDSQVTSLLFYWASKGYIKIIMKKNDRFTIEKLKEIDGNHKSYEKKLFNSLFKYGDGKKVTDSKLKKYFGDEVSKATESVKKEFKGKKELRDKHSKKIGFLLSLVSSIPLIALAIVAREVDHGNMFGYISLSIMLSIVHLVFYMIFYLLLKKRHGLVNKKFLGVIITSILYVTLIGLPFIFTDLKIYIIGIAILVPLIGNILSACIPRRSDYGKQLLGEIIGFRNFIEVAEKERLEALLEEDPEYFYNTLPYAQVLGVTKKWADKFKDISMKSPSYYDTYYPLNNYIAINRLISDLNKVDSTVNYQPDTSSSSGGGFGGGGFSGGGSGGGGGSSW